MIHRMFPQRRKEAINGLSKGVKVIQWGWHHDTRWDIYVWNNWAAGVTVRDEMVRDLYVKPHYRRRGFARLLMKQVILKFGHIVLTLDAEADVSEPHSLRPAMLKRFYRSLGFKGRSIVMTRLPLISNTTCIP